MRQTSHQKTKAFIVLVFSFASIIDLGFVTHYALVPLTSFPLRTLFIDKNVYLCGASIQPH